MTYDHHHTDGPDFGPGLTFLAAVILGAIGCLVFYAVAGAAAASLIWGRL